MCLREKTNLDIHIDRTPLFTHIYLFRFRKLPSPLFLIPPVQHFHRRQITFLIHFHVRLPPRRTAYQLLLSSLPIMWNIYCEALRKKIELSSRKSPILEVLDLIKPIIHKFVIIQRRIRRESHDKIAACHLHIKPTVLAGELGSI